MNFKFFLNFRMLAFLILVFCGTCFAQRCDFSEISCISCPNYQICQTGVFEAPSQACLYGKKCTLAQLAKCWMNIRCYELNECTQSGIFADSFTDYKFYVCINSPFGFSKYDFECPEGNFFDKTELACQPKTFTPVDPPTEFPVTPITLTEPPITLTTPNQSFSTPTTSAKSPSTPTTSAKSPSTPTTSAKPPSTPTSTKLPSDPTISTKLPSTLTTSTKLPSTPTTPSKLPSTPTTPSKPPSTPKTSTKPPTMPTTPAPTVPTNPPPTVPTNPPPTVPTNPPPTVPTNPPPTVPTTPSPTIPTRPPPTIPTTPLPTNPPLPIPFKCSTPGIFPEPSDCKAYFRCSTSLQAFYYICPGNSYFNENTLKCSLILTPACKKQIAGDSELSQTLSSTINKTKLP